MSDCPDHDLLHELLTEFREYRNSSEAQRVEAQRTVDARLVHLNELREQVTNDRDAYMRQDVYEEKHARLVQKLETIDRRMAWLAGAGAVLALLSGTIGALLGHFLR